MRFSIITTLLATAAFAFAAPSPEPAELVSRTYTAPSAANCKAKGGSITCCATTQASANNPLASTVSGLLGIALNLVLPNIGVNCGQIGVIPITANVCPQSTVCCQNPDSSSNTALISILSNDNLLTCNAIL